MFTAAIAMARRHRTTVETVPRQIRPRLRGEFQPVAEFLQNTALTPMEILRRIQRDDGTTSETVAPIDRAIFSEAGNEATAFCKRSSAIKTLDDLLTACSVDLTIWEVDHYLINKWEVGMMGDDGKPIVEPLFQVKAWLRRQTERATLYALREEVIAAMEAHAPVYSKPAFSIGSSLSSTVTGDPDGVLQEVSPFDLHIGKLAWGEEIDGGNYDSKEAVRLVLDAVDDVIEKGSSFRPSRFLLPLGNDLIHTDGPFQTTTNGTRQDADTRHAKMFRMAYETSVAIIDRLGSIAPVDVLIVPGNHDRDACFKMGEVLHAWYRSSQGHVRIDNDAALRKYRRWGVNLLGFTHGSDERPQDLPLIMAQERKEEWGYTLHREWHVGHLHKRKETRFTAGDTFNGVVVRILPSLCESDAWHYAHGYVKGQRATESYLWDSREGYVGHVSHNVLLLTEA